MTGAENFMLAEELLERAETATGDDVPDTLQAAQVRATLALTAAVVASLPLLDPGMRVKVPGGMTGDDAQAWADAIAGNGP